MLKKIGVFIITIIIIAIASFNGYKFVMYNHFKDYLNERHPDKSFDVHWVKYDFLYEKFYTKVYCNSDGTEFFIRSNNNTISEDYLITKNRTKMNKIINSYLENEDVSRYISDVTAGVGNKEVLNTNDEVDYNKIVNRISISFYNNSITDNNQFGEIAYEIINILKNNQVNFNYIYFVAERDKGVYELRLTGEEINKTEDEICESVIRLK